MVDRLIVTENRCTYLIDYKLLKNQEVLANLQTIDWLKPLFTFLIIITLSACQPYSLVKTTMPKNTSFMKQQPFYTYPYKASANLRNRFNPTDYKSLRLDYENGCVYLFDGKQRFIPLLPQEYAFWNEEKGVLNYYNNTFVPGYIIESAVYQLTPQQLKTFEKDYIIGKPTNKCENYPVLYVVGTPPGVISPEQREQLVK